MKDIFARRIKQYRQKEELTQEELALKIGISPQSVSKWERGEGFPDVSLLPIIANYFDITIDELLGNDIISRRHEESSFWGKLHKIKDKEDRIKLAIEFIKKFPKNLSISTYFILNAMVLPEEKREKHIDTIKEQCKKVVQHSTDQRSREVAINTMCIICSDEELKNWHGLSGFTYKNMGMEIIEERLWKQGNREISRAYHNANDLNLLIHYMFRLNRCNDVPEKLLSWCNTRIGIIESFSIDGKIPDLWLGAYSKLYVHVACAKFGLGEKDEGYLYLEKSLDLFEKWLAIPKDTVFFIGSELSKDGYEIDLKRLRFRFSGGREEYSSYLFYLRVFKEYIYEFLTCQKYDFSEYEYYNGWEHFNSVRDEDRFKKYLERAKSIAEK